MYKCRSRLRVSGVIAVLLAQAALGAVLNGAPARAQQFTVIKQAPVSPVVDGVFDDVWQSAPSVSILKVHGQIDSPQDATAAFRLLFDSQNLYVLVSASDDHLTRNHGAQGWLDDSIELFLNGEYGQGGAYGPHAHHLAIPLIPNDQIPRPPSTGVPAGMQVRSVTAPNSFVFEISIPWASLGVTPANGMQLGLDVHVNDNDGADALDGKLMWSASDPALAESDTGQFGLAVMEDGPLPTVVANRHPGADCHTHGHTRADRHATAPGCAALLVARHFQAF